MWPVDHDNRQQPGYKVSPLPLWELDKIVCTHYPYQISPRTSFYQQTETVSCKLKGFFLLKIQDFYPAVWLCNISCTGKALHKRGHPLLRFQRILRADQKPYFIKSCSLSCLTGYMNVSFMCRIEGSADKTNAPSVGVSWTGC